MKLMIDGYEVEIKAKRWGHRFNKEETMSLLTTIAIFASEAAENYKGKGLNGLEKNAYCIWNEIHDYLEQNGAFENL